MRKIRVGGFWLPPDTADKALTNPMTIYWLLFAFPALMALAYPVRSDRMAIGPAQSLALITFLIAYTAIGMMRHEIGGDWVIYNEIFDDIYAGSLVNSLTRSEPLFVLICWFSAQIDTGIYLVNGICCWILGYGTIRIAMTMREPWLAILIAVPYLLIVVGMGYVRQGAAIGFLLIAMASLDRSKPMQTLAQLLGAALFHVSAVVTFPFFVLALIRRNQVMALVGSLFGAALFLILLVPRLDRLEQGYITSDYQSDGAFARILMSLFPAFLVLLRRKSLRTGSKILSVWLMMALASLASFVALMLTSASTGVDRIALFFAPIQLFAFGEIRNLTSVSDRFAPLYRVVLIGVAGAVQAVWLILATHAFAWVPYKSVLDLL